jgi:tRNA1Val (adenine37-N6)-methyltransferase
VANYVLEQARDISSDARVLDLCAGCGVVGLELSFHLPHIEKMDFVELQDEFRIHFDANLNQSGRSPEKFRFIKTDFRKYRDGSYDLIVCNPPYFDPQQGKVGKSEFKNRCHFFVESTLHELIDSVGALLAPRGKAFLLVKDSHSKPLKFKSTWPQFLFEYSAEVRGTKVLSVSHKET